MEAPNWQEWLSADSGKKRLAWVHSLWKYKDHLKQQNKELEEYANHHEWCSWSPYKKNCTCGLDELLNK